VQQFTHLGRPIDVRHPSNLFAVAASAVVGLLAFLLADGSILDRGWEGALFGLAAFMAWALGREIDPDRTLTANASLVAGGFLAIAVDVAAPGAILLVMVAARITARTTGLAPKVSDLAVISIVGVALASDVAGWAGAMILAFAIARDATLPEPAPRHQAWFGIGVAVLGSASAWLRDAFGSWQTPDLTSWALIGAGLLGAAIAAQPEPVVSTCDLRGRDLHHLRVRWARFQTLVAAALAVVAGGADGARGLAVIWVTLTVAGIVRLARP
jgi:hypothetical protein